MSDELINAVRARIEVGRSEAEIVSELVAVGYTEAVAAAAVAAAQGPVSPELPTVGQFLTRSFEVFWTESFSLFKVLGLNAVLFVVFVLVMTNQSRHHSFEQGYLYGDLELWVLFFLVLILLNFLSTFPLWRAVLFRREQGAFRSQLWPTLKVLPWLLLVSFIISFLSGLGFGLLLIPGLLVLLFFWFAVPLTLLGRGRVLSSLSLSFRLVKKHFVPTLVRIGVATILAAIIWIIGLAVTPLVFYSSLFNQVTQTLATAGLLVAATMTTQYWVTCFSVVWLEWLLAQPAARKS